ncbi:DUF4244 domain-containing protein [Streptomyces sp. 3MP-14]|uniref:DUF4244 domain-containing protein n=1 Tax=Streptomyces mimosae TaxID=2586635 RepID=A0A5N6A739_9ACTN|nr:MULTISPECIES: DUF4244 domain-containing protein [Streptomyces]KAB8163749.1 DUF4244 domain-containing protein [Streptomyces mimosae]KAB8175192.1 DUF4244 domain-containing protein [Streptomyces sp. 3MP-14]
MRSLSQRSATRAHQAQRPRSVPRSVPSAGPRLVPPRVPRFVPGRAGRLVVRPVPWGVLRSSRREAGMNTVEYAIGTLAAAGFAAALLTLSDSAPVRGALRDVILQALENSPL